DSGLSRSTSASQASGSTPPTLPSPSMRSSNGSRRSPASIRMSISRNSSRKQCSTASCPQKTCLTCVIFSSSHSSNASAKNAPRQTSRNASRTSNGTQATSTRPTPPTAKPSPEKSADTSPAQDSTTRQSSNNSENKTTTLQRRRLS